MEHASNQDTSSMTPMLRQYFELKKQCPESILFFRMGDFYEIFGETAAEVAPLLNITLTSRDKGDSSSVVFCGVPHHSARSYWLKLLKLNYKVAIADQVEDPSQAKGLVRREVTKLLSPACIDDLEGLQADQPNYLMVVYEDPDTKKWLVALVDVSTGELRVGQLNDIDQVIREIDRSKPKELLLRRFFIPLLKEKLANYLSLEKILFNPMPEAILRDPSGQKELFQKIFGQNFFDKNQSLSAPTLAMLASLFVYLEELKLSLGQFLNISNLHDVERMKLDSTVINDLEIFTTTRQRQQKGSLFAEINYCLSPMGARLLRWNLVNPLLDRKQIENRHQWVEAFLNFGEQTLLEIRNELKGIADIERLLTRLVAKTTKPRELGGIRDSLAKIPAILAIIENHKTKLNFANNEFLNDMNLGVDAFILLKQALATNIGNLGNGDEVFCIGYDELLDKKNELSKNGEERVSNYQESLKKKTGIQSLKIKQHKNFGLLIEITKTNLTKIPSDFIRRQTMVNCERFVTVELQELNDELSNAKDDAVHREEILYGLLLDKLASSLNSLKKTCEAIASFDILHSFAWLAIQKKYCKPQINEDCIEFQAGRHPTVENFVGTHNFTPNNIQLGKKKRQMLITGPNMAGKSTIMRLVASCAILNQCGSFVPAQAASLPIFDQIFTRVGASDDLVKGLSTFMVEMTETAHILRHATKRSLVILDEVGRGTSTEDGLAIATAVLENLASKINCWTFFATHYHELVQCAEGLNSVCLFQTEVLKMKDGIKFTHRLIEGSSESSYGIEVAKLAGVPDLVIQNAREFLKSNSSKLHGLRGQALVKSRSSLDNEEHTKTIEFIKSMSTDRLTPIQALNIIHNLKENLQNPRGIEIFPNGQSLF